VKKAKIETTQKPGRQPRHQPEESTFKKTTLKDLCPEDKAKVGDLVKRLASQTKETKEI